MDVPVISAACPSSIAPASRAAAAPSTVPPVTGVPSGEAGRLACRRRDDADDLVAADETREALRRHADRLAEQLRPRVALELAQREQRGVLSVERQLAGQTQHDEPGRLDVHTRAREKVGLVLAEPEQLRRDEVRVDPVAGDAAHGLLADRLTQARALGLRAPVHPDQRRSQRVPALVEREQRRRLRADADGCDVAPSRLGERAADCATGGAPPVLGVLLHPAGAWKARRVLDGARSEHAPVGVDDGRLDRGRSYVDAEHGVVRAHSPYAIDVNSV